MAIDTIATDTDWGTAAAKINSNFQSVSLDLEKAKNSSTRAKGLFASLTELKAAYPNPIKGDWAVVGTTIPGLVYKCNTNGVWSSTGQQGGGGDVDLTDYLTSTKVTDITEIL